MERRSFLKLLASAGAAQQVGAHHVFAAADPSSYSAASIANDYYRFLKGERESLQHVPSLSQVFSHEVHLAGAGKDRTLAVGQVEDGWTLVTIVDMNGALTAVFEKRTSYRGSIAYITSERGVIGQIPTFIGDISRIRPRAVAAPVEKQMRREKQWKPGPDVPGDYILRANEDPSWESVAALGEEYIGWGLVANEQAGPERSLFLEPDGTSRQLNSEPAQAAWAPDEMSPVIDPRDFFPNESVHLWKYLDGYSKRTLLGGYTPTANIGVWNEQFQCGYELSALLPETEDATPMVRFRLLIPDDQISPSAKVVRDAQGRAFLESYKNCDARSFFATLAGIWNRWHTFFETSMPVQIPDENLLDSARAGIMLSRCSYRGLRPTYQIGEGAYTKIPERSHALFPVAHYEFIWAQQIWGLTSSSDAYFQYYLDHYILPDGNFEYNIQDQVEAPLNVGFMLRNSARGYLYTGDLEAFRARMPILSRMLHYVLERYNWSKQKYVPSDAHYGLVWGSPEADLGDPHNDSPDSHPDYYQNPAGVWRGIADYAGALKSAAALDPTLAAEAARLQGIADEMRANISRSLATTLARRNAAMKQAGITPFTPEDTTRDSKTLAMYENHRFMQDWFLADWGDVELDAGHLKHRTLSGMHWVGLHMNGGGPRTSNFMEHGTLAVKIRQEDYRSFLLTLYALVCFAADSGNRYSPEDALLPRGRAGEDNKYSWSATVNSVLQPTLGLRWLLCYEESDRAVCHLQKAAPCQWFEASKVIAVARCPTRFGAITWHTEARSDTEWIVKLTLPEAFTADILIHVHPPHRRPLVRTSLGTLQGGTVLLPTNMVAGKRDLEVVVTA